MKSKEKSSRYRGRGQIGPMLILLVVGVTLGLAGCRGAVYRPGEIYLDEVLKKTLIDQVARVYPTMFHVEHRLILTIRGREITARQHAQVKRPDRLRLAGISDFGATLYEIAVRGGEIEILRQVEGGSGGLERVLSEGAGRDAANMYLADASDSAELVKYEDGRMGLIERSDDGTNREYLFQDGVLTWTGYRLIRGNRVVYEIAYDDWGTVPGWNGMIPRQVTITHYGLDYVANLRVIDLKPRTEAKRKMM